MHPDVGAIIGISLAGSVLLIALLFLCLVQFRIPCCKDIIKPRTNHNRSNNRPSTSSRATLANLGFGGSTRDMHRLSVFDLQHQTPTHYYSGTGIVNPVWQLHCQPCVLAAGQSHRNGSRQLQVTSNACQCHHHHQLSNSNRTMNSINEAVFQYNTPHLQPSESPPPYPGPGINQAMPLNTVSSVSTSVQGLNPPPYSPKH